MQPESTRTCSKCDTTQVTTEFRLRKNGRRERQCRSCERAQCRQWHAEHRQETADRSRHWREKNPDQKIANGRDWSSRNQKQVIASANRWRTQNIERARMVQRAAYHVRKAVRTGVLVKPGSCSACGRSDLQITAAHHDYSKPLDIRWLCRSCHGRWDYVEPKTGHAGSPTN